jgi:hypothetical protein
MFAVTHLYPRPTVSAFLLPLVLLAFGPSQARATATATSTTLAITAGATAEASVTSGTVVTLTATVKAGSAAVQTGQVKFCDAEAAHCTDIHLLGIAQLTTTGAAALKFIPGPGVHSYKAEFLGTGSDAASASAASSLTVNGTPTNNTITQSGGTGNYTLRATVTGNGSNAPPTGKVSFLDTSNHNVLLGTAVLGTGTSAQTWTTPQSPATKAEPQSIAIADFNGDGIPDIAIGTSGTTATSNVGYINLLLGNGDGTFQTAKLFTALADNQAIAAAPFVDGGPEDILTVSNSSTGTNNALLLIGDGKGGFTAGTPFSLGGVSNVTALIAGDFNGDGKLDFVVAGEIFGVAAFDVFLGNGNGTFNAGTLNATADTAITAFGAGDFTGSGALDLAIAGSDGSVEIFLQDGAGDFFPGVGAKAGPSPTAIVVGDFNGDGKADLAITNSGDDTVTILLGNGSGGFTPAESPATGKNPTSIALGDFNGDGIADLAIANSGASTVTVLLGKGDGTFTAEPALATGNTPRSLAAGNFNGKNTSDLAVANEDPSATTAASSATILLAQLTQTTTATATGVAPTGSGNHVVDASYAGDDIFHASISATTSITGSASQAAAPVLSPAAGIYAAAQKITITDATPGATIYYTTNGTTPTTSSAKYIAPITASTTETIDAIAVASGYKQSIVAAAKYTIETPAATPTFSVAAGTYAAKQTVTISDTTVGAVIYYTTNGTAPTTASTKYTAAVSVAATETIEAIAVAAGFTNSAVAAAKYTIETPAAMPTFSVAAGTYAAAQSVQISDATPGATIYYTTNGAAPTPASAVYNSAVNVSATEYLQAIAVANGYATSPVASTLYSIGANVTATPVLSPAPGAYGKAQTVTITDATPGAVITYSIGIGSVVNTYTYTGPFSVSSTEYIAFDAIAPGYSRSAALEGIYTIGTVPAPQFAPAAGTYTTAQMVNIYDITPGATVYYTTDGTTPTTASAVYTGPTIVTANETIRAFAATSGLTSSAVTSAAYTIGKVVATPAFSLAPGSYTAAQSVAITDITPGTTIYYTINGVAPTTASAKYTGPVAVASSETIEAIAVANGYTNSAVATAVYSIGYPIETFVATSSGTSVLTVPVGGQAAFAVAAENQSSQSFSSINVKISTGANTSLPVTVTVCQTNASTGQCLAPPEPTVSLSPFAPGANATFSVFVTATAAIASSPGNEIFVLFTNTSGTVVGSASVRVVTD